MDKVKKRNEWWEWTKALFIAVLIAAAVRYFLFTPIVVDGLSMMPTLQDGDRMIVNKFNYKVSTPERFDVIVFHAPEKRDYIKRVIGLPGDKIVYSGDQLFINDKPVSEPYLEGFKEQLAGGILTNDFTLEQITGDERVPEGQLFVMGDNRRYSKDSRHIGTIDIEEIVGDTNLVFWPLQETRLINEQNQ
ncbi:signal peptidase I [Jeotgalibacillus sp. S-D1]|uniref:signal peptidase I n=1 Tax=Jeotgalibacillus sp. S-D1 TaxID=2552189 RepID=UPI001059A099|nr:signal peptidase I [Jeotgalibacillus sp. S-D1]TDL35059.1 signal peptidase I [Jeotgalibacillus sp. S-D1]